MLSERGQMAVEVAAVTPIILLVLVIAVDMLVFTGECARFDHIASQYALASTAAAADANDVDARVTEIQSALDKIFAHNGSSVLVTCEDAGQLLSSMVIYKCELRFAPWPLSFAGVPTLLTHTCSIAVDPYVPGALI